MSKQGVTSIFKARKPRTFTYNPVHYSEAKEELEVRVARAKRDYHYEQELKKNPELAFRERMNDKWSRESQRAAVSSSNRRIILIAGLLCVIAYFFLYR